MYTGGGGGFVPFLVFYLTDNGVAYACADIEGLHCLNDYWTPVTGANGFPLTLDTSEVYIATRRTAAIFWSPDSDKGRTYGNIPGQEAGGRLAVDLKSTEIIFIGAQSGNGLYKSTDAVGISCAESEGDASNGNVQGLTIVTFDKPSDAASGVNSSIYFVGTAGNTIAPIYVSTVADAT
ncbi:hypothetical protein LX32DRAFT_669286 [Colletotrichum zoysiae]|uniref:Uncharacterized protein n=1 Tax=Colletotrichum zoysiae TaxID=1216348 RepID=A0AAD9HUZ9_9PEZI|nr:hypothetical protein LX32DRAFT_669286 [Colletotrichum zoysiae]